MEFSDGITSVKGIGEKSAALFYKAGIYTVSDLLDHFPSSYSRISPMRKINEIKTDGRVTVNADAVFIFPNNKNIILAANQARDLTKDKKIVVIPTKTVPQCISAMIAYMPDASVEENEASMNEAAGMVKSGSLTYAVRDTSIDGVEIHEHDFMGIGDSGILSNGADIQEVMIAMLDKMAEDTSELISIYYGADVSEEDAEAMKTKVSEHFPSLDIEMTAGAQPVYYYIVSVE